MRFFVASQQSDGFRWPRDWTERSSIGHSGLEPGVYFIGQMALEPGIEVGGARVVQIPLPDWVTPPSPMVGSQWQRFLLVEVVPHDGPVRGSTIGENDNLACRRLVFTL